MLEIPVCCFFRSNLHDFNSSFSTILFTKFFSFSSFPSTIFSKFEIYCINLHTFPNKSACNSLITEARWSELIRQRKKRHQGFYCNDSFFKKMLLNCLFFFLSLVSMNRIKGNVPLRVDGVLCT